MLDELGSMLDGLTWAYFWNKPAKPAKLFSDFPDGVPVALSRQGRS